LGFTGGCSVYSDTYWTDYSLYSDEYLVFDDYYSTTNYTLRWYAQMKNLISIRGHSYHVTLSGNTFTANSVVRGVVYIETESVAETAMNQPLILISGNTFEQNFAYLGSSAIFIRKMIADFNSPSYY